jgi:hypothetical protein
MLAALPDAGWASSAGISTAKADCVGIAGYWRTIREGRGRQPAAGLEQQTVLIESVDDSLDIGLNGGGSGGIAREAARDRVGDGPGVVPAVAVGEHERLGELDRAGGPPVGAEGEGATGGEEPEIRAGAGVASPGR